jgi:Ni,Fe-hydrogenase I cytochrome b subunit
MKIILLILVVIQLIMAGIALYYDEYESAAWLFLSAFFFTIALGTT